MAEDVLTPEVLAPGEAPPLPPATPQQIDADAAALTVQADTGKKSVSFGEEGIQITSMADALSWGKAVINSGLAPKGFRLPSQVIVAAQMGREVGLGPAAALRAMYMTPQGRPALYAEAALALCMKSGLLLKHRHTFSGEGDSLSCTFYVLRKGDADWRSESFSVAEARQAGLVKADSNWAKWPKRMVLARSRAFILHDVFADVLLGIPVEGDLDDLDAEPPAPPPAAPPETKQPPPGGFGLLRNAMAAKAVEPAGKGPDASSEVAGAPAGDGQSVTAPASGGVAAAGRPTEEGARQGRSDAKAASPHAPSVPNGGDSGQPKFDPPGPPGSIVDAEMPRPPVPGCDHAPAIEYRAQHPSPKPIVCERCAVTLVVTAKGPVVVEEPPPVGSQKKLL